MRYESEKSAKGNVGVSYVSQSEADEQAKEMDKNNCSDCTNCYDCYDCSDCISCTNCSDCSDCRDFESNPERVVSPVLGSRNSQTTIYFLAENVRVVCGCFRGNLDQFQEAVTQKYGAEHAYHTWINRVKNYINS